jgi:hypothetical protein
VTASTPRTLSYEPFLPPSSSVSLWCVEAGSALPTPQPCVPFVSPHSHVPATESVLIRLDVPSLASRLDLGRSVPSTLHRAVAVCLTTPSTRDPMLPPLQDRSASRPTSRALVPSADPPLSRPASPTASPQSHCSRTTTAVPVLHEPMSRPHPRKFSSANRPRVLFSEQSVADADVKTIPHSRGSLMVHYPSSIDELTRTPLHRARCRLAMCEGTKALTPLAMYPLRLRL